MLLKPCATLQRQAMAKASCRSLWGFDSPFTQSQNPQREWGPGISENGQLHCKDESGNRPRMAGM
ncbi:MAG: hypothetical protein R3E79_02395 [Caldilineaceae bacterium]